MHILTLTTLFPNALQPHHAIFVRARMEHYKARYGHRWTVVAPVPYFPKLPLRTTSAYDAFARVPVQESPRGYPIYHPRYLVIPKFAMHHYGNWMTAGVRRLVARLHSENPFDVIDSHYVYPDGTAAVRMGEELGLPVVLSARGTDLNLYPSLPGIADLIRENLESCRQLICVCGGLKAEALKLGISPEKVRVIGNGVDGSRFCQGNRHEARLKLGIPQEMITILSVGHLTSRKGFDLLIEACARLNRDNILLIIVGDGPERRSLELLAARLGMENRVRFTGAILNDDLPTHYQAADLFALASSREGWPNVLCEAQACGLPAVATDVWGIPEIIREESLGLLVRDRTTEGLRATLDEALNRTWDRNYIESIGRSRTWDLVAEELNDVFGNLETMRHRGATSSTGLVPDPARTDLEFVARIKQLRNSRRFISNISMGSCP